MPTDADYRALLAFRVRLREFDQWSRGEAEAQGLTHAQHQLLLAVRGHAAGHGGAGEGEEPTVGDLAGLLLVRHHTAGELVDRTQALGLVERVRDEGDHRRIRVRLTDRGRRVLHELTAVHLEEVRRLGEVFALPPDGVAPA